MNSEDDVTFKGLFLPFTTKKAIIFIFLIGFFVFFNSLFNGFVGDDDAQIIKNFNIHSVFNIPSFFTSSTFYNGTDKLMGVYYKPLLTSYFSIMYSLFGSNSFMFHFVQVLLHIINSSLLFLFLNKIFRKSYSFILSLIFMLHPFQNEVVFYVSAMQEILFFFFGILSLIILEKINSKKYLFLSLFLMLLSLFSKETGILFVFIGLVYLWLFKRKFFSYFLISSLISMFLYFFLRVASIGLLTTANNSPIDKFPILLRLINLPEIILFYLRNFILPLNFSLVYDWAYSAISFKHFVFPVIIDLLVLCLLSIYGKVIFLRHRAKYFKSYLFFISWFVLGIVFHSQIFPLDQTVADRWFYFIIVGLLGIVGIVLETQKIFIIKRLGLIFVIVLLSVLSARTFIRSFDWRDSLTLYNHDIKVTPNSFALQNVLGLELLRRGRLLEAKQHVERSISLYPYFSNYDNLGEIYVGLGDYKNARRAYLNALKFGDYYLVYEDLAGLSLVEGSPEANMKFIAYGLSKFPKDAKLWLYLAIIAYENDYKDLAKKAIIQSYLNDKSNPSVPGIYNSIMKNEPLNLKINKYPD